MKKIISVFVLISLFYAQNAISATNLVIPDFDSVGYGWHRGLPSLNWIFTGDSYIGTITCADVGNGMECF